ncbi:MAG TPA: outer membrane beta-barrel protein [Vicinamibacterales bacterium]|jgi:opacity protein-like surface antigen|nr:outer membrane beta-barrel protein [Vicinamibacterales bacterium]
MVKKLLVTSAMCAAAFMAAPATASADWVITPFVGWNFGGSADVNNGVTGTAFSNQFEHKIDYGVSVAQMGAGIIGWEADFGYSPNFFETGTASNNAFDFTNDSNVTTLTGNVIVGAPLGGHGGSIRPYAVGGVGLIRTNVQDAAGFFQDVTSKNDFGFDIGAGVMGYFAQNVGIRGDVRYFRSFNGSSDNVTGLGLSNFHFWRGSVGVSFKF